MDSDSIPAGLLFLFGNCVSPDSVGSSSLLLQFFFLSLIFSRPVIFVFGLKVFRLLYVFTSPPPNPHPPGPSSRHCSFLASEIFVGSFFVCGPLSFRRLLSDFFQD